MSPLYSVIFSSRCTSTHHRLALDALRHLRGGNAQAWANVFLVQFEAYLKGAKAPDDTFKDFKNHVLHVAQNYWGGADRAAQEWYAKTVEALRAKKWKDAAYNAGVLSHYVVDPIQPFHTAQSETENVIHRAVEQSFSKSYALFQEIIEARGFYPDVALPAGPDWLIKTVRMGADAAHPLYDTIIDHYDFARGARNPLDGLDDALREAIAPLVARAAVTFARVLERAIEEAAVKPPFVLPALDALLANMAAPIHKMRNAMAEGGERAYVRKMHKEFVKTGKVSKTLPEDDRAVRALHAQEVLKVPLAQLDAEMPRAIGGAHGSAIAGTKGAAAKKAARPAPKTPA
ncbi:MAG TPA: zinc dependent phospholipase C family protein, partial [Caulobacterales bacterium]|nr:zinc dependent phospholipase C family protein [Caulobacterales bacterium]